MLIILHGELERSCCVNHTGNCASADHYVLNLLKQVKGLYLLTYTLVALPVLRMTDTNYDSALLAIVLANVLPL